VLPAQQQHGPEKHAIGKIQDAARQGDVAASQHGDFFGILAAMRE
jgi:hypothetical protein